MRYLRVAIAAAWLLCFGYAAAFAQQPQNWPQITAPTVGVAIPTPPTSLTALQAWKSGCLAAVNARAFSLFAALAGAGTVQVKRYFDKNCAQPAGPALPATALALSNGASCPAASYCGNVSSNDGMPFLFEQVTLTDTSNATNAVVGLVLLQAAE